MITEAIALYPFAILAAIGYGAALALLVAWLVSLIRRARS